MGRACSPQAHGAPGSTRGGRRRPESKGMQIGRRKRIRSRGRRGRRGRRRSCHPCPHLAPGPLVVEEDTVGEPTRSEGNEGGGLWLRRSHGSASQALWWKVGDDYGGVAWTYWVAAARRGERETLGGLGWGLIYRGSVGAGVALMAMCARPGGFLP